MSAVTAPKFRLMPVMWSLRCLLFATVTVATLVGTWLAFAWLHPPASPPKASIRLVGYTSLTMSNPDTNVFCYPGRGSWLQAQMLLTNEGRVGISYGAWDHEPYGWANVQTEQAMTNGYLAPPFTGDTDLLRPNSSTTFSVFLPTNTVHWQCGFTIETTSLRESVYWRILESKFSKRFPSIFFLPLLILPDKFGPRVEVKSYVLQFTNGTPMLRNKSLKTTTIVPGG